MDSGLPRFRPEPVDVWICLDTSSFRPQVFDMHRRRNVHFFLVHPVTGSFGRLGKSCTCANLCPVGNGDDVHRKYCSVVLSTGSRSVLSGCVQRVLHHFLPRFRRLCNCNVYRTTSPLWALQRRYRTSRPSYAVSCVAADISCILGLCSSICEQSTIPPNS